ncbi:MAG: diacylglycerol kinase [Bacteroidetes bacterium]|nr:diacylglycerol kinase [Bacteroidota bacterium]
MERKIIYLINPISGTRGKTSVRQLITQRTEEAGVAYSIHPTNASGNYDFLRTLIQEEKVTDIVVCGGDGTVSAVMAALVGTPIRVGVIPMGSGNGLAFAAKLPKDPAKALDIVFAGKASSIDGFLINGLYSCMLCGIGFDGQVAHEFATQPKRGLETYARVTLKNFFTARTYPFRISIPAQGNGGSLSFTVDAFFINIANGDQFGNHFTIAPKASLQDGMLDIVIVKKKRWKLSFLLSVIRQVLGGYPVQEHPSNDPRRSILYFRTPSLEIANPEYAPVHIDGDPGAPASEFVIKIVPNAIQLIQP